MTKRRKKVEPEFDEDRMKLYMSLSAEEKLRHLEALNALSAAFTTPRGRKAWQEMKKRGW